MLGGAGGGLRGQDNHEPILIVEANMDLAQQLVEQLGADGPDIARTADQARFSVAQRPPRLIELGDLDRSRGTLDLLEDIRWRKPQDGHRQTALPWPQSLPGDHSQLAIHAAGLVARLRGWHR